MRKYKKVSECPPLLCELMEVYNVLPYKLFELQDYLKKLSNEGIPGIEREAIIKDIFEQFDPILQEYLTDNCGDDVWLWINVLKILESDERTLNAIQNQAEDERLFKKCKAELKAKNENLSILVNN